MSGDGDKLYLEFKGSCLKLDKSKFSLIETKSVVSVVRMYIDYEITKYNAVSNYPTLEKCLFGAIKLTKNPDIDKCKYSGYGIGFDRKGKFSFGNRYGHNVIIFGVDMSSSVHANNKTKDISVLGEGITQELCHTTLNNKKFCLSLHYNGANSYLFVNGTAIIKLFKKESELIEYALCLGNISGDFFVDNMLKTGLNGRNYEFSVDYRAIEIDDILDIHKYQVEKNNIK